MRNLVVLLALSILAGCVHVQVASGAYELSAMDSKGKTLRTMTVTTDRGTVLYSARNALCSLFPQSTVVIKHGGGKLFEQPYRCGD